MWLWTNEREERRAFSVSDQGWQRGVDETIRTWHIVVAYDGTGFRGWQIQPGPRTVQYELQMRLQRLFRDPGLTVAATSRTDGGVHALGQHVSFLAVAPPGLDADGVCRTLNRWLPPDVQVLSVSEEAPGFHARYDACSKAYTYVVHTGERCSPLFYRYAWQYRRAMDVNAMRQAASYLEGEHDFKSFSANPKRVIESHVRTLHAVEVHEMGDLLCVSVIGNSFLYKMVRGIVGYLVHVGLGQGTPEETPAVLAARDRSAAAASAPPQGLFLARVFFEEDEWRSYEPILPPFAWH